MKNNITELVFILDRSGSMSGLEADTIGGFNSMIEKHRKDTGDTLVSCVLFDHESEVIYDRVSIEKIEPMTNAQYFVRGSTALIDAMGSAIKHISNVHKYIRSEDMPENTIFIIATDGYENASRKYTAEKVRRMVSEKKEKDGWEFIFLGANIDAVQTAKMYGIDESRAANYNHDSVGTKKVFEGASKFVSRKIASSFSACECAAPEWKEEIELDYKQRGKKSNTKTR